MAQQQRKLWWKISTHGRVLGQGLKSECVDIFHQSFLRRCAILTSPNWAKQLSMATIPFCFEFFRCHVDVLQHYFSRSTISIAVFCLQNLICLLLEWCWVCLVPRHLSFDENVRAKEGGNETPAVCTLPMVPCGHQSPVTRFALAMRRTKRLRRRLMLSIIRTNQNVNIHVYHIWKP